jgi:beta-1,4-mannosyl-glycoprotein beta-1,4-N-acetylglucosaminyltransferase
MRKIYDCFIFFNELELLELRLNILDSYVDYFVICEASVTHSGIPKTFLFEENKDLFSKFLHKIIHIKISDIPTDFNKLIINDITTADGKCVDDIHNFIRNTKLFNVNDNSHYGYGRDFFQKESLRRGLINCDDDDIIILSDCDEIPNPKIIENIEKFINDEKFFTLNQSEYYYYLNLSKCYNWKGSRIGLYKNLKKYSFNELRAQTNKDIENGGWHFSYMGGSERVKTKIQSYSHTEMNTPSIINSIEGNMNNNSDPLFRGQLTKVEIDNTYPKYLLDNLDKYKHMIK